MHEMSIAQSLIAIVKEEMDKHGAKILRNVHLNIGKMSAVVPESLSFCFEVLVEGTELQGAKLLMKMIPLRGHCPQCRSEFEIEDYAFLCPSCGASTIDMIGGQDLSVVEIEVG